MLSSILFFDLLPPFCGINFECAKTTTLSRRKDYIHKQRNPKNFKTS